MSVASRPHSAVGDPTGLLAGAALSAEVLLIRPKPIRPTASESDAARSSSNADAQSPQRERASAAATAANTRGAGRPLGAFTLVMPAATTSVYERELCSLFRRTALANDPTAQHDPRAAIAISRIRRSRTPNQPHGASTTNQNAGARRPCSACYHEVLSPSAVTAALASTLCNNDVQMQTQTQTQTQRCPLSDLVPLVRARGVRQNTFPPVHQVQDVRHYSEPLIATNLFPLSGGCSSAAIGGGDHTSGTRKRRRKETDENASEMHGADWADSPLPESGDDEAIDPDISASPTRADSKCRRRIVASTVRPSINAEKMLTASSSELVPCRHELPRSDADDLSKRSSETYSGSPSTTRNDAMYSERLATMHASFSVADGLLANAFVHSASVSTGEFRPTPNSDEVERALRAGANSSATPTHSGNSKSNGESIPEPEEAHSDDCDACSSLGKSTELASFAPTPNGTAQFRIISELDIDQIENN